MDIVVELLVMFGGVALLLVVADIIHKIFDKNGRMHD